VGDTFNNPSGSFSPNNLPSGLGMVVTLTSPTVVTVSLTGNATASALANSIANLGLAFSDGAFTHGDSVAVTNANVSNWTVKYYDGNKWYVSAAGSDSADGSSGNPFATIAHAIAVATNYDYVHILGTVTENPSSTGINVNKALFIEGDGPAASVVQAAASPGLATGRVFTVTAGINGDFRNLTIRNGYDIISVGNAGGGGIYAYGLVSGGSLLISNCVLTGNMTLNASGGAVEEYNGSGGATVGTTIYASTICSNSSASAGGGVYQAAGQLLLYDSAIFGNSATGTSGGAVSTGIAGGVAFANVATGLIQNCTICNNTGLSSNKSISGGGGIYAYAGANAAITIRNSTIANNSIPNGQGGGIDYYNNLILQSTIVAGNTAAVGYGQDVKNGGTVQTLTDSYCLIGNNTNSVLVAGTPNANNSYVGTGAAPIDPLLLPIAYNAGPTPTMSLQLGSLAIDHGANPANLLYDQREVGYSRIVNGQADIGAFEYGATPPSTGTGIFIE